MLSAANPKYAKASSTGSSHVEHICLTAETYFPQILGIFILSSYMWFMISVAFVLTCHMSDFISCCSTSL